MEGGGGHNHFSITPSLPLRAPISKMDMEGILLRFDELLQGVQEKTEEDKETIEAVNTLIVVVRIQTRITRISLILNAMHARQPSLLASKPK